MPGYEITRFVDRKDKTLQSMMCLICQSVYCNPLMTACCKQTFCEGCIRPWVESNNTCPYDQNPLKIDQLVQPPNDLVKNLNAKKIKCIYAPKGCKEITAVEAIGNHEKYCIYDKQSCKVCGFVATSEHDCHKSLFDYKQNMTEVMDKLRKELDDVNGQNMHLRSQLDNFTKTIKDLALDRSRLLQVSSKNSSASSTNAAIVSNNKDLLMEARKYVNSPSKFNCYKTPKETANKIMEVVKEAITTKGEKIHDVARFIKESLDSQFMGDWNVYMWYNNIGFVFHNITSDGFIEIKFGRVLVVIYKTFDSLAFSRMINFIKTGFIHDLKTVKTGFDQAATGEIEKIALDCIKTCTDMTDFCEKVSSEMMNNYGGVWYCFIYKSNFGYYCVRSEKDRFCLLTCADVKILIFM